MVVTRSKTRKIKVYRSRVKTSPCRNRSKSSCRKKYGCKMTKGTKRRHYCRKKMNRSA